MEAEGGAGEEVGGGGRIQLLQGLKDMGRSWDFIPELLRCPVEACELAEGMTRDLNFV